MKASQLISVLQHIVANDGDQEVHISALIPEDRDPAQRYVITEPTNVDCLSYSDGHKEVSIRDWPY